MATLKLANWTSNLKHGDLPPEVQNAARRAMYNWIGCAIGGSNHPTVAKAYAALSPLFGVPTATLLGRGGERIDAQHAALLNGIASHVHDYDDTHLATIIHPSGPVASALLAYAQMAAHGSAPRQFSGEHLLTALVAGIEAACKLGLAVWPTHYDVGWHITGTTGSMGAAVGVAHLMGLDAEHTAHAIGLAAVQVIGLREMFGSDTKSFHPGRAAQSGLLAALCAAQGFTSSPQALEAKRGWANVVIGPGGTPRLDELLAGLGETWEIAADAFKPFPCGIVAHPANDACIRLHAKVRVDDIENVRMRVHPLVIELTSKRTPRDGLEAKFSVFHGAAVALLFGRAGPAQYADNVVTSTEVVQLRDRIDAKPDEGCHSDEAEVFVTLRDGRELHEHVVHAVGSIDVPMTDAQLTDKFIDQVSLVVGQDAAQRASEAAWGIGGAEAVDEVVRRL